MRVIGIDPGFDRCGVAVAELSGGKERLLFSTCIETPRTALFGERLRIVGQSVEEIIDAQRPAALALETLFFNQNRSTAFKVAEVRGMLLYIAATRGLSIYEYSPQAVKIAITGHGASNKGAMATMIERLYRPQTPISRDDEYDAIAVAMTCLTHDGRRTLDEPRLST